MRQPQGPAFRSQSVGSFHTTHVFCEQKIVFQAVSAQGEVEREVCMCVCAHAHACATDVQTGSTMDKQKRTCRPVPPCSTRVRVHTPVHVCVWGGVSGLRQAFSRSHFRERTPRARKASAIFCEPRGRAGHGGWCTRGRAGAHICPRRHSRANVCVCVFRGEEESCCSLREQTRPSEAAGS